jgi:hypothetical protein
MCEWCGKHPAAFDVGNGALECEPCAKRGGLVRRGELKAALDMLGIAAAYAYQEGATHDEVLRVVTNLPARLEEVYGGEVIEVDGAQLGEPGEWQRGYVALDGGEAR